MKIVILLFALLGMTFTSCHESWLLTHDEDEYILFGHFHGECIGEDCVRIFKLTEKHLFRDQINKYPGRGPHVWKKMSDRQNRIAQGLPDLFPDDFLDAPQTYGCPDCSDQGGIIFILKDNSTIRVWNIDKDKNQIPEAFHPFVDKVIDVIDQIK